MPGALLTPPAVCVSETGPPGAGTEDPVDQPQRRDPRDIAREVVEQHVDGRCPECPAGGSKQRCRRWITWWPVLISSDDRCSA